MRYLVKIYHYGKNYSAMAPDLPGCVAAADTIEQLRRMMAKAIALHLDKMCQNGEKIPKPTKRFNLNVDDLEDEEICTWVEVSKRQLVCRRSTRSPNGERLCL
jgi:predicted RNase H-like HicB family nuclease